MNTLSKLARQGMTLAAKAGDMALLTMFLVLFFLGTPKAQAVNTFPLKPDGSNAAPATVYGDPFNALQVGKLLGLTSTAVGSGSGQNFGVNASTVIPVSATFETVISSGLAVLMTSTPNISTSTSVGGTTLLKDGTFLILTSTASAGSLIFQDEGTLTGSKLQLGAATRTVGRYDILALIYSATDGYWREVFYSDN